MSYLEILKKYIGDIEGVPRLAPAVWGGGGFPAPLCINDQNHGEVAGQNKGPNLKFLQ